MRIIETTRGYEACQKAIQNYDTLTGKSGERAWEGVIPVKVKSNK